MKKTLSEAVAAADRGEEEITAQVDALEISEPRKEELLCIIKEVGARLRKQAAPC